MPRYFLHIRQGDRFVEDLEGSEHPHIAGAHAEAIEAAREIMADQIRAGRLADNQEFLIFNEDGDQVAIIPFRAALGLD